MSIALRAIDATMIEYAPSIHSIIEHRQVLTPLADLFHQSDLDKIFTLPFC
jgi:hypothetical protein